MVLEPTLKNVNFLNRLISLKKLYITDNTNIENIDPIRSLINLEELDISNCNLKNIDFLQEFHYLKVLNLSDNNSIENYDPIKSLKNLEVLNLSKCGIKNTDIIKNPSLKTLILE